MNNKITIIRLIEFISFFLILSICQLKADDIKDSYSIADIPAWVNIQNYSDKNNSEAGFGISYYLLERQISFIDEKKDYFRLVYALDEQAALVESSQIYINYYPDYQSVELHKIYIIRNGKIINALNKDDIVFARSESAQNSLMLTGKYTLTIPIKGLQQGDIVDYSYTINGKNPVMVGHQFFHQPLGWRTPLNNLYLQVLSNKKMNLSISKYQHFLKKRKSKHFEYELSVSDLDKYSEIDLLPESYEYYPYIQGSDFDSWRDVSRWGLPLFQNKEALVPELVSKIANWKAKPKSSLINAIKFVQDDIRYFGLELGVNSHMPHQPNEVFNKKFGDCKDKVLLLNTILKELGYSAKPVLVSMNIQEAIANRLPSPYAFDHVISMVEVDGKKYFIDPTQQQKGKQLESLGHHAYGKGLVISDDSKNIIDINIPDYEFGMVVNETYQTDDFRNNTKLNVKTIYKGISADSYRAWYKLNNVEDIRKSYLNFYKKKYPDIKSVKPVTIHDNEALNQINVEEEYNLKSLWESSSKYYYQDFYSSELRDRLTYPKVIERSAPIKVKGNLKIEHAINFIFPKNINLTEIKESGDISSKVFDYKYETIQQGHIANFKFSYESLLGQVPVSEIRDYLKKVEEVYDKSSIRMVVNMDRSDQKRKRKSRLRNLIKD